ncbi:MAG: hypothetical protein BJ554DRAFT_6866 [Olpidium bornovanus]|uniref:Nitrogen permease regulator 3 n=1 Tax=Olpidium bornovanus TaxID=278681 RepID=A0A8H7ZXX4_9FUNG|nr:MAG: hypothetical protein BJ554DRAFT_6866 [Olpidium bornovanus]
MTSLLAVVLVVSSSRGHHFVFSYPANPRRSAGNWEAGAVQAPKGADGEAGSPEPRDAGPPATSGTGTPSPVSSAVAPLPDSSGTVSPDGPSAGRMHSQAPASRHPRIKAGAPPGGFQRRWTGGGEADGAKHQQLLHSNGATAVSDVQTVLGYNTQFLANVLTPKRSLCDRRFQMTVGDLTFLGHPVYIGTEGEQDAGGRGRRLSGPPYSAPAAGVGEFQTFLGRSNVSHPPHRRVPSMSAIPLAGAGIGTPQTWRGGPLATAFSEAASNSSSAQWFMPTSTASSPEINFLHPKGDNTPTERSSTSSPVPADARARTVYFADEEDTRGEPAFDAANRLNVFGRRPADTPGRRPPAAQFCADGPHQTGRRRVVPVLPTPTPSLQSAVVSPPAGEAPHASGDLTASSTSTASPPSGFVFPCLPSSMATATGGVPSGPTSATQTTSFHLAFILDPDPLERNRVTEEMYRQVVRKLTMALRHEQVRDRIAQIVVNGYLDLSLQMPKIRLPNVVGPVCPATEVEHGSAAFDGARSDADFHHAAGALQLRADDVAYCLPAGVPRFAPYFTLLLLKEKEEILRALPADASGVLIKFLEVLTPTNALIPSRDQRSAYLGAVAFLLARGIIVQLHTYVYLLIPPHVKLGLLLDEYERLGYGSALAAVAGDTARIVSMPAQSTEMERDWISKMAKGQTRAVAENFLR